MTEPHDDDDVHTVRLYLWCDEDGERRLEFRIAAEPGRVRLSFGPAHEDHPVSYTVPAEVALNATAPQWLAEDLRRVAPYAVSLTAA